ncbi:MAG TPA: hypothetical protein VLJ14_11415 [Ktedonobacterales bacterium]|nr:hypothetical protein [Ktedonobacterales bacterium]
MNAAETAYNVAVFATTVPFFATSLPFLAVFAAQNAKRHGAVGRKLA